MEPDLVNNSVDLLHSFQYYSRHFNYIYENIRLDLSHSFQEIG